MRALSEEMKIVDTANQLRLEEIVKKHGWPEKKMLVPKLLTPLSFWCNTHRVNI